MQVESSKSVMESTNNKLNDCEEKLKEATNEIKEQEVKKDQKYLVVAFFPNNWPGNICTGFEEVYFLHFFLLND